MRKQELRPVSIPVLLLCVEPEFLAMPERHYLIASAVYYKNRALDLSVIDIAVVA